MRLTRASWVRKKYYDVITVAECQHNDLIILSPSFLHLRGPTRYNATPFPRSVTVPPSFLPVIKLTETALISISKIEGSWKNSRLLESPGRVYYKYGVPTTNIPMSLPFQASRKSWVCILQIRCPNHEYPDEFAFQVSPSSTESSRNNIFWPVINVQGSSLLAKCSRNKGTTAVISRNLC